MQNTDTGIKVELMDKSYEKPVIEVFELKDEDSIIGAGCVGIIYCNVKS